MLQYGKEYTEEMYYVWVSKGRAGAERAVYIDSDGRVSPALIRHGLVASVGVSRMTTAKRLMYSCTRNSCFHLIRAARGRWLRPDGPWSVRILVG